MRRIIISVLLLYGTQVGFSQPLNETITVDFDNLPLEQILDSITYKSGYFFSYNADALPPGSLYTIKREEVSVDSLLTALLVGTGLEYLIEGDQVILRKRPDDYNYRVIRGGNKKSTISGWVRQYGTNDAIIGANVFLNGTTIGGVTDKSGNYSIKGVPEGTHQLVISFVGFETNAYQIKALKGDTYILNTFLKQKTRELPSIEIISRPLVDSSEWTHFYRLFEKEFIGYTPNSNQCEIENPQVIGFTYDPNNKLLNAYAEEPIHVINRALGYKIQCQLAFFEKRDKETRFHIRASFEDLSTDRKRVRRRWKRNRKITYEGSSPHFFKSLIEDRFGREGFRCYLITEEKNVEVERDDILRKDSTGFNWVLEYDSTLIVRYTRETESMAYLDYISDKYYDSDLSPILSTPEREPRDQVSMVELSKKHVILFSNGQVQNPEDIIRLGYWSWKRMADLMPINYEP